MEKPLQVRRQRVCSAGFQTCLHIYTASGFGNPRYSRFGNLRDACRPIGAGGGTRTRTSCYGPRILSPVRLPFRHSGSATEFFRSRRILRAFGGDAATIINPGVLSNSNARTENDPRCCRKCSKSRSRCCAGKNGTSG